MKIKLWVYRFIYEPLYSLKYSFKEIGNDLIELISKFQSPRTWSTIFYLIMIFAIIKNRLDLFKFIIPTILAIYVMRQRLDGRYKKELFKKALAKDDDLILKEIYQKYKRNCFFKKVEPNDYEVWKEKEIKKLNT